MQRLLNRIRNHPARTFAASAVIVSPVVLGVQWWMSTQAPQLNEDQQFVAFVGIFLPFLTVSVVATTVLFRHLSVRPVPWTMVVSSGAVAAALAWPLMVPALVLHDLLQLPQPMLDERTPAPLTWWITFALGWVLLAGTCGLMVVSLTHLRQPVPAPDHVERR